MKRFKNVLLLAVLVLACAIVGCTKNADDAKVEKLISQYEQACGECDMQRAMMLAEQIDPSLLSPEQSVRVINASNLGAKVASENFRKIANSMPYNYWDIALDRYEELIGEYADLLKEKISGRNVKDKMRRQEDKIGKQKDKLDDAKLTKKQKARFKKLKDWYDDIED